MNIRDFIVPAALSFITLYLVNTFFPPQHSDRRSGGSIVVEEDSHLRGPIQTTVDFDDATLQRTYTEQHIATPLAEYTFANATGSAASWTFVHPADMHTEITTLAMTSYAWEQYAFLLALDVQTPFYYELVDVQEQEQSKRITYRANSEQARIVKTYTIYQDTHQIDLELSIEPYTDAGCVPRLFVPAPYMYDIAAYDTVQLVTYPDEKIVKHPVKEVHDKIWPHPSLFGAEDRYFLHALINDRDSFVQRAYARTGGEHKLTPIFEGPRVKQATTWHLSFYCGPKEAQSLNAVDSRLEATLEYGWLAPISKFMLWILQWLYTYVGNYGWAIILLTAAMRLLLFPFAVQGESQMKSKSGEFARKKKLLEQKYKNDQETLAREQYKLAKEHGVLPSMMGCLPMLLQIPVFIGLNYALRNSILLYKAPFVGWIQDLSAPDPYYILPLLVGGSMLINAMSMQQQQQRMTLAALSVVIVGVTAHMSSGLALYIAASTMFAVAQTYVSKAWKTA